jgi:hypothetical protein
MDDFVVDEAVHRYLVDKVATEKQEYGGAFVIDTATKTLKTPEISNGGYDRISFDRGIVEFHTHPTPCKDKQTCTVPLGSPEDLVNIVIGQLNGVQYHILYSNDGQYVLRLRPTRLAAISDDYEKLKIYICSLWTAFDTLHNMFIETKPGLGLYRQVWIGEAERRGFEVVLWDSESAPIVKVNMNALGSNNQHIEITKYKELAREPCPREFEY